MVKLEELLGDRDRYELLNSVEKTCYVVGSYVALGISNLYLRSTP